MSDLMVLVSPYLRHDEVKSQSALLLPFANSVFLYFIFVRDTRELWTTTLKCAPIVFLILYILTKGFGFTKQYKSSQRILLGLIFSCVGDALLNIDLFAQGMGTFAIAQICYISAFGWRPLKLPIGLTMFLAGAVLVALVFKNLDTVLMVGLPLYASLLLTMCWRAVARGVDRKDFLNTFCGVGSVLFVISDGLICIDMFYVAVPYARIWIMVTYYMAQFAIAVSTARESKTAIETKRMTKASPSTQDPNQSEHVRKRVRS